MAKNTTDTSARSLREEKERGMVGIRQTQVLNIITAKAKGITDREIHLRMTELYGSTIQVAHITPRRNELWKFNLIERGNKRPCTVTGKLVYTWNSKEV
jgi:hypothetical protein